MPFQPFRDLPDVLASADVLMAVLEEDAGVFSVPSKVLTCLCAGRPLLLGVPEENLAARIVKSSEAGVVSRPSDVDAFVQNGLALASDPATRATMGAAARRYAESAFDIEAITDRFVKVLTPQPAVCSAA
jgi:colanic acid biosynthesis glycosyl transferase WcaI